MDKNQNSNMFGRCKGCQEIVNQNEIRRHIISCRPQTTSEMKICPMCNKTIDKQQFQHHINHCSENQENSNDDEANTLDYYTPTGETPPVEIEKKTKICALCSKSISETIYAHHISSCQNIEQHFNEDDPLTINVKNETFQTKQCPLCLKKINENDYSHHVSFCSTDEQFISTDSSSAAKKSKRDCFVCFKSVASSEFEAHVLACAALTDQQINQSKPVQCFICKSSIRKDRDLYVEMSCDHHHIYCLPCLKQTMEDFARNRQTPVCHKDRCDYELSRHDLSAIPLERRLFDRLIKLVKGKQRPLCSKCQFYVNLNDDETFDDHVENCLDLIPCEYCQLPFAFNQLEIHSIQCRNDKTSFQEKLTNFILNRTKYPFTKEQVRFYIHEQMKNSAQNLDPHSIIESLTAYGKTFPYEMPRRDCDICTEAYPYDDIYVFDCADSHKLCYDCYHKSCLTKMSNGEILTCPLCSNPLRDGEINQLRVSNDELIRIKEYQMKKTFEGYSNRTRGIIKCPNQNCQWVAEAADPNERFHVQCPLCEKEFCSLCNQQYHYRTSCQQLPQITQRWFHWCQTERARYLQMRAKQDETFSKQLSEYNRRSGENEHRNRDLRRRYEELMNDEKYKADNCRLCPSCKRVVQRLEGCDTMICGQDAHGGNVQSGCGQRFNWSQAANYKAAQPSQPKQVFLDLPKPENPVVNHQGVKCDFCQNEINGIRFDCVHCPSLTFCEKCEQQATLTHSEENQQNRQQQHVFQLIMTPQDEAIRL